jgi:hypothetical protein
MKTKRLVVDRRAAWVDFYFEVEVDDDAGADDNAVEAVQCGEADYIGCSVQDSLEFVDGETEVIDCLPCYLDRG